MKKWTAFLLSLCLLVPILPAQAVEGAPGWAAGAYETLEGRSILEEYKTSGAITRYDFVDMLVSLIQATVPQSELRAYPAQDWYYFEDTPGYAVLYGVSWGILDGVIGSDGGRYANGLDHLTREQAAKMTCSLLDFFSEKLGHTVTPSGSPAVYQDAPSISSWALPFTQRIAAYGLMKGDNRGNFDPQGELNWPSAMVMGERILSLLDGVMDTLDTSKVLVLQNNVDWSRGTLFGANDGHRGSPKTGWQEEFYTIHNGDGTVSTLAVGSAITVERFNADGSLAQTWKLERELPIFGTFFDSGEHFYLAFGQRDVPNDPSWEIWRVVQYDRNWNRLGSASASSKETYTEIPFRAAIPRMAVSGDGQTVTLYAARERHDGHQSNITFHMNVSPFSMKEVWGNQYPKNHVSHTFGQFVRYDGDKMVTVDHGDGGPRSFVFQDGGMFGRDLLEIAGKSGENITHAIGSGFQVTDGGYLFLGCSTPQEDFEADKTAKWNVFLAYTDKEVKKSYSKVKESVRLTWLTDSDTSIRTARLVKLDGNSLVAMWDLNGDIHWQKLDGMGNKVGSEQVLEGTPMPPTDPVVINGDICWVQTSYLPQYKGKALLYRLEVN